ncbi:MAG: GTPase [Variibacter sp.]|jgi:GTP-binding protein Era|nr:GTPase [Variibacter sp.]
MAEDTAATEAQSRCGFVALIGAPNAGKSTLVNALVGSKVSIVTPKVQTTRTLIRGIAIEGTTQLILVDTPGIFHPKRRLDRAMVTTAWTGAHDADIAGLLIDAKLGVTEEDDAILEKLGGVRKSKILILNKVDIVAKEKLLTLAATLNGRADFTMTFMVSALKADGVRDMRLWLASHVPEGPWLYPADQLSDAPLRHLAAEVTREKLYLRLHDELPYRSTVETDQWTEKSNGIRVDQTIYVERESQRKIVLGKAGQTIKAIGMDARKELTEILERPVHLFLFVKVRQNWENDPDRYREMGLDFPKE